jgi:hypothetical protein
MPSGIAFIGRRRRLDWQTRASAISTHGLQSIFHYHHSSRNKEGLRLRSPDPRTQLHLPKATVKLVGLLLQPMIHVSTLKLLLVSDQQDNMAAGREETRMFAGVRSAKMLWVFVCWRVLSASETRTNFSHQEAKGI